MSAEHHHFTPSSHADTTITNLQQRRLPSIKPRPHFCHSTLTRPHPHSVSQSSEPPPPTIPPTTNLLKDNQQSPTTIMKTLKPSISPSSTTEPMSQNPKPKKPKPKKQTNLTPPQRRNPPNRSTKRHITKPMTKEEGAFIDFDTYVGKAETSSKKRKRRVDLGKEKLWTDSRVETHAETTILLEVQPKEPNIQHFDHKNMAELWKEVPIFTLSAPSPIVQQEYKPDEWNSEIHNTQSFVEQDHFENVATDEEEPILLEWPHEITPPQTIHSPEGTTTNHSQSRGYHHSVCK
ncbi:hypothetical protein L6452_43471 [Arctium lappa]|uniref:Uncharacterized protein n=1 Tax=Arctium lappa TaxID=4217 RepID=A0ACB8XD59_ARCLA|nr:hypothetical protein L6452_43471 [Arctium lappa]